MQSNNLRINFVILATLTRYYIDERMSLGQLFMIYIRNWYALNEYKIYSWNQAEMLRQESFKNWVNWVQID